MRQQRLIKKRFWIYVLTCSIQKMHLKTEAITRNLNYLRDGPELNTEDRIREYENE
jgi:hypothetical protein